MVDVVGAQAKSINAQVSEPQFTVADMIRKYDNGAGVFDLSFKLNGKITNQEILAAGGIVEFASDLGRLSARDQNLVKERLNRKAEFNVTHLREAVESRLDVTNFYVNYWANRPAELGGETPVRIAELNEPLSAEDFLARYDNGQGRG